MVTEAIGLTVKRSVKKLHFGGWVEKEEAAVEIRKIAMEGDRVWRKSLAGLGVISCLVSMLDSDDDQRVGLAALALLELANGTYTNKALMVEAGILPKLKALMKTKDQPRRKELFALLLSISSLDKTHFTSFSSGDVLLPILAETLTSSAATEEVRLICLTTLCNLSTKLENIRPVVSNGLVPVLLHLLTSLSSSSTSEALGQALVALGNIVVTATGRKAIEDSSMVPECFVKIMTYDDQPTCQELAAYVLMVLAHGSSTQRSRMVEVGAVQVLLGAALLGSELGRRRALKLLEWLKGERQGVVVRAHSGPQMEGGDKGGFGDERESKKHRRDMQKMVKQSLDRNMETITRRAGDHPCASNGSSLLAVVGSSSSKSLPF